FFPVAGLPDHFKVGFHFNNPFDAFPKHGMIINNQDFDFIFSHNVSLLLVMGTGAVSIPCGVVFSSGSGMWIFTRVPPPARDSMLMVPSSNLTRSFMPKRPK